MKKIALLSLAVAAAAGMSSAQAATADMTVTADVAATCSVNAATMAFGTYNTLTGTALASPATAINFTCSNGATYSVSLSNGANYDTTGATRRLIRTGAATPAADDYLTYKIYEDSAMTVAFDGMSGATTGAAQSVTLYGKVDGGQTTRKTGSYTDTVVITITAT